MIVSDEDESIFQNYLKRIKNFNLISEWFEDESVDDLLDNTKSQKSENLSEKINKQIKNKPKTE
jgi:hypothetical protein